MGTLITAALGPALLVDRRTLDAKYRRACVPMRRVEAPGTSGMLSCERWSFPHGLMSRRTKIICLLLKSSHLNEHWRICSMLPSRLHLGPSTSVAYLMPLLHSTHAAASDVVWALCDRNLPPGTRLRRIQIL
jgi:hypothetical protein